MGWEPCAAASGGRVREYRLGDVDLTIDDTMIAVLVDHDSSRRSRKVCGTLLAGISDYSKGNGTRLLKKAVMSCHSVTMPFRSEESLEGNISAAMETLVRRQVDGMADRVFQNGARGRVHVDIILQRARLARWRTSPLCRGVPLSCWRDADLMLDAAAAHVDACFLKSDRMAYISSSLMMFVLSAATLYEVCSPSDATLHHKTAFAVTLTILVALWALALLRK